MKKQVNIYHKEEALEDEGYEVIAGCDEVGRNALAGPIFAACVVLPNDTRIKGLDNIDNLSDKKISSLAKLIIKEAVSYSVTSINSDIVDQLDPIEASKRCMLDAINKLNLTPDYILIDTLNINELMISNTPIIQGDKISASIMAAKILAKSFRDTHMKKMDFKYPNYGFARHKGFYTKEHIEALEKYGPCEIHRRTFSPISKYFQKQLKFNLFDDED